jgi:hypothetical protein
LPELRRIAPHSGEFLLQIDLQDRMFGDGEANEFAIEVLRAEGFDAPDTERQFKRALKERFIEHFGMDTVSRLADYRPTLSGSPCG